MARISSLDSAYQAGDLSIFPAALDTLDTLYQAANNATTVTTQGITYGSKFIVVEDASSFPLYGLIKLGDEIIYYGSRTNTVFKELVRGFAGTRQNPWIKGTDVSNSVFAEHHNAVKDAVLNVETDLGIETSPASSSLNGILNTQEHRFLAPTPTFRAFPTLGAAPLTVTFQNFSGGLPIRFLWDFGDGSTSVEKSPIHTYVTSGTYTVQLNMITALGAHGVITKTEYINISDSNKPAFFYATPLVGIANVTDITFIDQTGGSIASRYWIFDDGEFEVVSNPDIHTATHKYAIAGTYRPSLLVVFSDDSKKKLDLNDEIIIQ